MHLKIFGVFLLLKLILRMLLASSGQKSGMLPNNLQHIRLPPSQMWHMYTMWIYFTMKKNENMKSSVK